jgi:hypothetical protein
MLFAGVGIATGALGLAALLGLVLDILEKRFV